MPKAMSTPPITIRMLEVINVVSMPATFSAVMVMNSATSPKSTCATTLPPPMPTELIRVLMPCFTFSAITRPITKMARAESSVGR